MVAVVASGVSGSARLCSVLARERARGGDEDGRRVREVQKGAWRRQTWIRTKERPPARSRRWPASTHVHPARSCFGARGRKMTGS